MELYLMRHGRAGEPNPKTFAHDAERPLTPEGIQKTKAVAAGMAVLKLNVDAIVSSPFTRARQTAEIAATALGLEGNLHLSEHLAANGDPQALIQELLHKYRGKKALLLVGHEPYLSQFAGLLTCGGPHLAILLKKAGLILLNANPLKHECCAQLEWLLPPKILIRLGKSQRNGKPCGGCQKRTRHGHP